MTTSPATPQATDVVVALCARGTDRGADHVLLLDLVAGHTGTDRDASRIEWHCAHCGSDSHGQPSVIGAGRVFVSLSRSGTRLALAVGTAGPVGIDLESLTRFGGDAGPIDDVAFTAAERHALAESADPARDRAALWTAKEAVLKATGQGLRVDPRELSISLPGASVPPSLVVWPGSPVPLGTVQLAEIDAGVGFVASIAVFADARPTLRRAERQVERRRGGESRR